MYDNLSQQAEEGKAKAQVWIKSASIVGISWVGRQLNVFQAITFLKSNKPGAHKQL